MLVGDPCISVDVPPVKPREMQALSVQECRHFLEVAKGSKWFAVFATLAVAAGVSVEVISDQLGHASISFTLERFGADERRLRTVCLNAPVSRQFCATSGSGLDVVPRENYRRAAAERGDDSSGRSR